MQTRCQMHLRRRLWLLALPVLLPSGLPYAAEDPVAVFSQVYNGYTRTKLPDGSFKPEAYTFGNGGNHSRAVKDPEMEQMTFIRVARSIAKRLEGLNYVPALTSDDAELLILVFWGSTQGSRGHDPSDTMNVFSSSVAAHSAAWRNDVASRTNPGEMDPATAAAESAYDSALWQMDLMNRERDRLDDRNARILGYSEHLSRARFVSHMSFAQDIINEVEDNRYYVVLQAYDFKTAVAEKKLKPLWTARISMPEQGNNFAESLDRMLLAARKYIGRDSRGMHRYQYPEGRVDLGPLEVIETVPDK